MAAYTLLCLSLLLSLISAGYCPQYTCDSNLATNVCAAYTSGSTFKLNSNGCQANYFCSSTQMSTWAILLSGTGSATGTTYSCTANPTSTAPSVFTSKSCGTKMANKNFKNGQSVVACASDTDCLLVDGTYTDCMCVIKFETTGICEAHVSNDQVFSGFWKDCGVSGVITDQAIADYWTFYLLHWEFTQSTVNCMGIFKETATLSDLYDAYIKKANATATNTPTPTPTTTPTTANTTTTTGNDSEDSKDSAVAMSVLGLLAL